MNIEQPALVATIFPPRYPRTSERAIVKEKTPPGALIDPLEILEFKLPTNCPAKSGLFLSITEGVLANVACRDCPLAQHINHKYDNPSELTCKT